MAGPVLRAAHSGIARRRVQSIVIGLVIVVSTAASALALGLLVDANAPFDRAFAAQRGAHVTATVDFSRVSAAQLAAATRLPGVAAAAGPFPLVTVTGQVTFPGVAGAFALPPMTLSGRPSPGGPVDDITLDRGRWARAPGEIVVSRDLEGPSLNVGQQITVTGVPGSPRLTVVGIAKSITDSAAGWVTPGEVTRLRGTAGPVSAQLLYRFRVAGTAAEMNAEVAALRAALPAGALAGWQSYLTVKLQVTSSIAPWVPFIVAFGVIGLVMSVLIVVNVVSGEVVAGYRRIGVLKSIGFTPAQVVAVYVGQVAFAAVAGCLIGVVLGNLLSLPLLAQSARVFGVGTLAVPVWVDVAVPVTMCALALVAALLAALRAGRLSAVQAIATGRAPRPHRGYAANRLLGTLPLPRPLTIGLAAPFARPSRSLITMTSVLLGSTAVIFAVGLSTSLGRASADLSHAQSEPVQVQLSQGLIHVGKSGAAGSAPSPTGSPSSPRAQQRTVESVLASQPGTRYYVAEARAEVSVPGLSQPVAVRAFRGNAAWTGYALITGHWYQGSRTADVNTYFLTATGKSVGDLVPVISGGHRISVRITGEVFDPENNQPVLFTDVSTLAGTDPGRAITQYDVGLRPGTSAQAYANAIGSALGPAFGVGLNGTDPLYVSLIGLEGALTLLLVLVAGLGVLNTVVLATRERVHDLGVFKALGMTPRQVVAMVQSSVAVTGLAAGCIAVPAGLAVHRYVIPQMGRAAQTGIPAAVMNVYRPLELVLLALSGLLIAWLGALLPATWAARARADASLRTE